MALSESSFSPSRLNLLVVETDGVALGMCREHLSPERYELSAAQTGKAAREICVGTKIAIAVITDELPDMDGFRLLRYLKEIDPDIEAILLTTRRYMRESEDTLHFGWSGCIERPIDRDRLLESINKLLELRKLREENIILRTLLPIYELGDKFIRATSESEVFQELLSAIQKEIGIRRATIMMLDEQTERLRIVASIGIPEETIRRASVEPGERVSGWVFEQGKPVILNKRTQGYSLFAGILENEDIEASLSFPMTMGERVVGVINISQTKQGVEYSSAELELVSVLSRLAVIALQNVLHIRHREEVSRIRALFEQYVAPEVAGMLIDGRDDLLKVGRIEKLTVLFADIRNFTLLVQLLPLTKLRRFLNAFFGLFTEVVYENHGTLDKFMGDAALVIFGAPVAIECPSRAAVDTAVRILEGFKEIQARWHKDYDCFSEIGLGIGISRGEMFIGNVGSRGRLDYTVIGTDVNIAQRLASDTRTNKILITEPVYRDLGDFLTVSGVEERTLRGLAGTMKVYTV